MVTVQFVSVLALTVDPVTTPPGGPGGSLEPQAQDEKMAAPPRHDEHLQPLPAQHLEWVYDGSRPLWHTLLLYRVICLLGLIL